MAVIAVTALAAVSSPGAANAAEAIVVASKIDTEGALLGNMIAELVAARGIAVERRIQVPLGDRLIQAPHHVDGTRLRAQRGLEAVR